MLFNATSTVFQLYRGSQFYFDANERKAVFQIRLSCGFIFYDVL
jgi:hypothetical protein